MKLRTSRAINNGILETKDSKLKRWPGRLGNNYGTVKVPDAENLVYVCVAGKGTVRAFNNVSDFQYGRAVIVGYSKEDPDKLQVLSVRTTQSGGSGGGSGTQFAPASRYRWMDLAGGEDPLYVELRQFMPLRPGMGGGMNLQIYRGIVWTGSAFALIATQNIDLASYIPTTPGKAALVLVTIDTSASIVCTKSSEEVIADIPNLAIPTPPAGTIKVLAAVRVYYGQIDILEARTNTDLIDLRFAYDGPGSIGSSAFTDLSDTFASYSGLGGQYIKVKADASGLETGISTNPPSFIEQFNPGIVSDELFTVTGGVNEFDLLYEAGYYHLWYSTYDASLGYTHHRSATTVAGLSSAADTIVLNLCCPTAQLIGSTWHIWVTPYGGGTVYHYTATDPDGAYTLADTSTSLPNDPSVRYRASDGYYYFAYVNTPTSWAIGLKRATDPDGPWTDLGLIGLTPAGWYTEEADPDIFFIGAQAFILFSGWDGSTYQEVGIVEIDTSTWQAKTAGILLASPTASWMQRGNSGRIFNPIYLEHDNKIYFAQNPGYTGTWYNTVTGWGYLAPGGAWANSQVSVLDTATVDLTLSGQQISADVIPGGFALSAIGAPTGDVSMNSHKITSLSDPASAQDAATKAYVDAHSSSGGGDHVHGIFRVVAVNAQTTYDLPDFAEYIEWISDNGAIVDPNTYSLANNYQLVLDTAITAAHVIQVNYVELRI